MIWLVILTILLAISTVTLLLAVKWTWRDIGLVGKAVVAFHNEYREIANDPTRNTRDRAIARGRQMAYDQIIRMMVTLGLIRATLGYIPDDDEPSTAPPEAA